MGIAANGHDLPTNGGRLGRPVEQLRATKDDGPAGGAVPRLNSPVIGTGRGHERDLRGAPDEALCSPGASLWLEEGLARLRVLEVADAVRCDECRSIAREVVGVVGRRTKHGLAVDRQRADLRVVAAERPLPRQLRGAAYLGCLDERDVQGGPFQREGKARRLLGSRIVDGLLGCLDVSAGPLLSWIGQCKCKADANACEGQDHNGSNN